MAASPDSLVLDLSCHGSQGAALGPHRSEELRTANLGVPPGGKSVQSLGWQTDTVRKECISSPDKRNQEESQPNSLGTDTRSFRDHMQTPPSKGTQTRPCPPRGGQSGTASLGRSWEPGPCPHQCEPALHAPSPGPRCRAPVHQGGGQEGSVTTAEAPEATHEPGSQGSWPDEEPQGHVYCHTQSSLPPLLERTPEPDPQLKRKHFPTVQHQANACL